MQPGDFVPREAALEEHFLRVLAKFWGAVPDHPGARPKLYGRPDDARVFAVGVLEGDDIAVGDDLRVVDDLPVILHGRHREPLPTEFVDPVPLVFLGEHAIELGDQLMLIVMLVLGGCEAGIYTEVVPADSVA